ncbi:MAG: 50S ribosomal protein L19 [Candidatus Woykebacteria bacterium RBG_13_40_15]|uniref:50S ribosomal protein L19 n=1 Tax=Candidatus Woykebacteria bacterium RBG_13_40_15 TaxID=1802593 RepID=A0A1G1W9G3_9BACT|nr:MAG: 50S ribosomal protein L19 [Candidatus Woykebacteria bacterium RBG_13_40_15]
MENKDEVQISPGDLIRVDAKVKEGGKERIQSFEGTIISIRGTGDSKTFTVRKIASGGIGVERIWPLNSPTISKIKVIKSRKQKKAKLFYIRGLAGKEATGKYL